MSTFPRWVKAKIAGPQRAGVNVIAGLGARIEPYGESIVVAGAPFVQLAYVLSSGVAGGSHSVGWQQRPINTISYSTLPDLALSSNQFTLGPGTFLVNSRCQVSSNVEAAMLGLWDVNASAFLLTGNSSGSALIPASEISMRIHCRGVIYLEEERLLEFQSYAQSAQATTGMGLPTSSGQDEKYFDAIIWKLQGPEGD